jgi:transitional endoplasmic reticulum ATPase
MVGSSELVLLGTGGEGPTICWLCFLSDPLWIPHSATYPVAVMGYTVIMKSEPISENSLPYLVRLWLTRLFMDTTALKLLVTDRGFRDDDVGRALGFGEWIDDDRTIERSEVKYKLAAALPIIEEEVAYLESPDIWDGIMTVGETLGLNRLERKLLLFLSVMELLDELGDGMKVLSIKDRRKYYRCVGRLLREPVEAVKAALSPQASLMQTAILKWSNCSHSGLEMDFELDELPKVLLEPDFSLEKAIQAIVARAAAPTLTYGDFPHLKTTLELLRPALREALRSGRKGMNIYIYGVPGTGKSELARVLAREMRAPLYEVSCVDEDGDPLNGNRRLNALRAAQAFLSQPRALLVFDEAEDIFAGSFFSRSLAAERKGWMNQTLENNSVPTFWISNSDALDPAFMRRFDFVFELPTVPKQQRMRSYRKLTRHALAEPTLQRLAAVESLAPAVVARASEVVRRVGQMNEAMDRDAAVLHLVGETLKAQGHREHNLRKVVQLVPPVFNLDTVNCETDLAHLVTQFDRSSACRLCLYGPPGTGKTTFGHFLAERLNLPLHVKKASDILDPYVGRTEAKLANLFQRAESDEAILMIDEVDSFLQDRRQAQRSWEVTQVNELLTQMERFEGIFIASTNLVDGLDPAALRRFDLKLAFDFLRPEQVALLLKRQSLQLELGTPTAATLREAQHLGNATPGDFANAARQHRYRKFTSPSAYLEAVAAECRMKEGGAARKVGF